VMAAVQQARADLALVLAAVNGRLGGPGGA
jgi:hypothetical protein